jgi:hypothetical protein
LLATLLPCVTSRTQEKSWWTWANAPRPHNERVSLVLSHRLITYDLFLSRIVKFTVSLESPYIWDTSNFEGVTPGIHRMTPDDTPRDNSLVVEMTEDVSHNWPHWEGTIWTLGIGCLSFGAQGQCGHTLLKVCSHVF